MIILSEILSSSQKFMSAGECFPIIIDGKFIYAVIPCLCTDG